MRPTWPRALVRSEYWYSRSWLRAGASSRRCASRQEQAITTAREAVDFRPERTNVRLLRQGLERAALLVREPLDPGRARGHSPAPERREDRRQQRQGGRGEQAALRLRVLLAAALLLSACSGGDDDAGATGDLVERLPGNARAISVVDLAEIKDRLGLPADTDPTERPGDGLARARLFAYSAAAFPYLVRLERPLMDAVDESRVTAAASTPIWDRTAWWCWPPNSRSTRLHPRSRRRASASATACWCAVSAAPRPCWRP